MGCNLSFIAFDHAPDLSAVNGLLDYQLFKRKARAEWYLEGPPTDRPGAILLGRPTIGKERLGSAWPGARREYHSLVDAITDHGRGTHGLDYLLIPIALALSGALQARLLVVSGNDEDLDCAFICSAGRLVRGRFLVGSEESFVFDVEYGSRVEKLDWSQGHRLYELASIVAADYFREPDSEHHAGFWEERNHEDFDLVDDAAGLKSERWKNRLLGCAVIGVGSLALLVTLMVFRSAAIPVGLALLAIAFVWRYWPSR